MNSPQHDLPILGEVHGPILAPNSEVARLPNFRSAMGRQFLESRRPMSQGEMADAIGMDRGQFSCVLNGSKHMPGDKWSAFNQVTGRMTALQWLCLRDGFCLTPVDRLRQERDMYKARLRALGEAV